MPSGIFDVLLILLGAWLHSRTGDRLFTCAGMMLIAEIGLILLVAVPNVGGKLLDSTLPMDTPLLMCF